jgi:hypothetical protein
MNQIFYVERQLSQFKIMAIGQNLTREYNLR